MMTLIHWPCNCHYESYLCLHEKIFNSWSGYPETVIFFQSNVPDKLVININLFIVILHLSNLVQLKWRIFNASLMRVLFLGYKQTVTVRYWKRGGKSWNATVCHRQTWTLRHLCHVYVAGCPKRFVVIIIFLWGFEQCEYCVIGYWVILVGVGWYWVQS